MNISNILATAGMVAVFAIVHLFIGRLRFLSSTPRSQWLSFSGGIAVSYVFLHVLPDLGVHERAFAAEMNMGEQLAESLIYSLALIGLAAFYGLERAVKRSRARSRDKGQGDRIENHLEWVHVGSYSLLNLLIGYLLMHREEYGTWALLLYFVAMTLHFMTSDFGMREDHAQAYDARGRWVITAAVIAGWLLGIAVTVPPVVVGFLFAFLAGGITLNVLKEELPEDRESRFLPFVIGAGAYSALMLAERAIA